MTKHFRISDVVTGVLVFCICWQYYSWRAGAVFLAGFAVLSVINQSENENVIKRILLILLAGFMSCLASQFILGSRLWYLDTYHILIEMVCFLLLFGILFAVTGNDRTSIIAVSVFLLLLTTVDYYVAKFRGNEIVPSDIFALSTALSVAAKYDWRMGNECFYGIIIWVLVIRLYAVLVPGIRSVRSFRFRMILIAADILLFMYWKHSASGVVIRTWGTNGATVNGFFANYSAQLVDLFFRSPPEGYSDEVIKSLEVKYNHGIDQTVFSPQELPDVIVILEESFADLSVLGSELNTETDVLPYFRSMEKNTIKGYALSSVYGGDTANSEYEVLTGNSMAFFGNGVCPYQLYVKKPSWSLVSYLKQYGYYSIATHPYLANGWSRTKVYPLFGFDEMQFIDCYPQENIVRNRVSDQEMFEYIVSLTEERKTEDPLFIFGVTMQNHGGYTYTGTGYTPNIDLNGYEREYPDAEQYLGLIHESDKAIQYLIEQYQNSDHPTVILLFGDHLPNLDQRFYDEVHGGEFSGISETERLYTVPFFIWANYDIDSETDVHTSLNYLNTYLLPVIGVPMSSYSMFLKDVEREIPSMNAFGYYSSRAQAYSEYGDDNGELLKYYEILQYNSVFEDQKSDHFFSVESIR